MGVFLSCTGGSQLGDLSKLIDCLRCVLPTGRVGQYACACGKSYNLKQVLVRHQRYECGNVRQFQCPYCAKRVARSHNLTRHIMLIHLRDQLNVPSS
ncbi:hypothetical protein J6590_002364 [Homalodisca vitripennis]|nr:hypothetical protein J6590_002364 [Homalodisca vitripennis]